MIGVGTPFGDDAAGLLVAEDLAADGVEAVACGRPLELLDAFDGADAVVLVDATRSGRDPGTVHEPALGELREARPLSSHGLGVRQALELARALGRGPQRVAIVGVEAQATQGMELSAAVRAALPEAAARVRECCRALAGATPPV